MPVPLSQLAMKLFVKTGEDVTVPGLVWEAPPSSEGAPPAESRWESTAAGQPLARPKAGEPLVFLLEKGTSTNNPFAMGVTIGRVDSNDLVLDDNSVSRFHAWFQQDDRSREWALTDAESKNGSWVDGAIAAPRVRMPLRDGAKVKLGEVELTFHFPDSLKAFVSKRFKGK